MSYPTVVVHAPRQRPAGVGGGNKVVLFSKDKRHPGGEAFLAEGDEAEVWNGDPEVKALIGTGALVLGPLPRGKSGEVVQVINPDSLAAVEGLDARTIDALGAAGCTTVAELVDLVTSGDIDNTTGIGPKRKAEIVDALVLAGKIEPEED